MCAKAAGGQPAVTASAERRGARSGGERAAGMRTWRYACQGLFEGQLEGGGEVLPLLDAKERDSKEEGSSRAVGSTA